MRILMDAVGGLGLLRYAPVQLLNSFAYADTGSVANHKIIKPPNLNHTWESKYGYVTAGKYLDACAISVVMETVCETPLVAKALGVFEHFMHNSTLEVQDIHILDVNRIIDVRMQDLNADNLYRITLPTSTSEEWWDDNVLPILEKIW